MENKNDDRISNIKKFIFSSKDKLKDKFKNIFNKDKKEDNQNEEKKQDNNGINQYKIQKNKNFTIKNI